MNEDLVSSDQVVEFHPLKTRVSLKISGLGRYLKYDYVDQHWVFCAAVGKRIDFIDPEHLCLRGSGATTTTIIIDKMN
jgi:hypothetical protein